MDQLNDTKRAILECSLRLFSENGFAATSVRQIAREVGVRESAIYNHFKGKDDIIEILLNMYGIGKTRSYIEKMMDNQQIIDDPYKFLRYIVSEEILDLILNNEANKFKKIVIMEMFCDKNARDIIESEIFVQARKLLGEIFQLMIIKKLIKPLNPQLLANEFLAPLVFVNLEHLIASEGKKDKDYFKEQIENHIDFFWNSIKLD